MRPVVRRAFLAVWFEEMWWQPACLDDLLAYTGLYSEDRARSIALTDILRLWACGSIERVPELSALMWRARSAA